MRKMKCSTCAKFFQRWFSFATDCECHPLGSASLQCNSLGQCLCRLGVSGSKCGECELNHFNLTIHGCEPCNCDPVGSNHTSCDPDTGQCICRPGVEGRRCDECMLGYYDLSIHGCKGGCGSYTCCHGYAREQEGATILSTQ